MTRMSNSLTYAVLSSSLFLSTLGYADIVIDNDVNVQVATSISENITIAPTGSVTVGGGLIAVKVDSSHTLTLEPNNVSGVPPGITVNALPTEGGFNGAVVVSANSGKVIIGSGSGINASIPVGARGVELAADLGLLDNAGTITSDFASVAILPAGTNSTIINRSSGIITSNNGNVIFVDGDFNSITNESGGKLITNSLISSAILLDNNASGTIINSGTISNPNGIAGINIADTFGGTITNSGVIEVPNNIGITATGANSTFVINNSGIISAKTVGIFLDANMLLDINNSGTIQVTEPGSPNSGINLNDGITVTGDIHNSPTGIIKATNSEGILIEGILVGDIINDGSITSLSNNIHIALAAPTAQVDNIINNGILSITADQPASNIFIEGGIVDSIQNFGIITSASTTQAPILVNNGGKIIDGIINSGNITSASGTAIDFTNAAGANITLTQNAGTITGDILGSIFLKNIININGGMIDGNITLGPGVDINTVTMKGGSVTGNITLGPLDDIFSLSGGSVGGDIILGGGNDTVNLSGGSILGNIDGNATSTLNILGSFSSTGKLENFKTVETKNAGTVFTVNNILSVAPAGTFTINAGTFVTNNNQILDLGPLVSAQNFGTLQINDGALLDFSNSTFVNDGLVSIKQTGEMRVQTLKHIAVGDANYEFELTDINAYGKIFANSPATNVDGDLAQITLSGLGFISQGDKFTIIDNQGNVIAGPNMIIGQPASQTLTFTLDNSDPTQINIIANRNPFPSVTQTSNAASVGEALDLLVKLPNLDPDIKSFIGALDGLTTQGEINNAINSLAPTLNNALIQVSHDIHTKTVDNIIGRVDEARYFSEVFKYTMPAGDEVQYGIGGWAKAFGSRLSQRAVDDVLGYHSSSTGITIGFDRLVAHDWRLGGAFTYAVADIDNSKHADDEIDVKSYQLTLYGATDYKSPFAGEALFTLGSNKYKSTRRIIAGTFTRIAKAEFNAWQYGAKAQGGYNFILGSKYRVTPLLGLTYMFLDLDPYTESDAGGLSLTVERHDVSEFTTSFGVKFSSINEYLEATYVPEIRFMAHYDFINDREEATSHFIGHGAIAFDTRAFKPDPITYNIGLALTAHARDQWSFSINYDFEFKKQFLSHTAFLKVRYDW